MSEARHPKVRVPAWSRVLDADGAPGRTRAPPPTGDSYQNFLASMGMGTANLHGGSTYGFLPLTRERLLLEWMYRGSWICGVAVDAVADDMVKMGIDFGGALPPQQAETIERAMIDKGVWNNLNELIKWGRLYGGAVAIILIDGQDPATPLRYDTIAPGAFKGLLVLDRWQLEPSFSDLVREPGPNLGLPRFYKTLPADDGIPRITAHCSRVFRYEGVALPRWQRVTENYWGMSIYERLYDRLTAFDSTTQGVAQLVYRAYLRIIKMKGLRDVAGQNEQAKQGLVKRVHLMGQFQSSEGVTLLDADDDFQVNTYAFTGLDTVLLQFGQQLAGALQIPLVRLFGQSPAGLNATGESDMRLYYDGINQQQELRLRYPATAVVQVIARSEGIRLPSTFGYAFRPLWQLTSKEKAEVGETITRTVLGAEELGTVSRKTALKELRGSARETGVWTTITDDDIAAAENDLPQASELLGGPRASGEGEQGQGQSGPAEPGGGAVPMPNVTMHQGERSLPVPLPSVHLHGGDAEAA